MNNRIFIAINFPDRIINKLVQFQKKYSELPVNWTKKENLHLTLSFLGNITDQELVDVCLATKKITSLYDSFSISFNKIDYGAKNKDVPRLIWAKGEKSSEISSLKYDLEKSLFKSIGLPVEPGDFVPHVTLARIRKWEWMKIDPEDRPSIVEDISLSFLVNSIDIIESKLGRTGPRYTILESCLLK